MRRLHRALSAALLGLGLSGSIANAAPIIGYSQTNLVSDLPGIAAVQDLNLQNPWGVSESATSPLWISDQHAGVATLYTVSGLTATPVAMGTPPMQLVVTIPPGAGTGVGPTGQVNNSIGGVATTSFQITQSGTLAAAHFIFANLNGTISAWTAAPNPAQIEVTTPGAVYTGLAIGGTTSAPFLYAANGAQGRIDVFDGSFTNVTNTTFAGKFVDPNPPAGYVPFNVQNIGGNIYVTYAPATIGANRTPQTMATAGQGFVDVYSASGNFISRLISGSQLAAPWGIVMAPATGFGQFSGDLLVGNFSYIDGQINAYNPTTGAFLGTLDSNSAWQGLWALTFGNGGSGGSPDILYFTTGLNAEMDGLFAALSVVPEPSTLALLGAGLLSLFAARRRLGGMRG
jgi:uncharacterized protein (TIGR03118 family)